MNWRQSSYDAWFDVKTDTIYVRDLCEQCPHPALSVTNDAENVVRDVVAKYGDKRVLYYDTMGELDELLHDKGTFRGFAPGPNRKK